MKRRWWWIGGVLAVLGLLAALGAWGWTSANRFREAAAAGRNEAGLGISQFQSGDTAAAMVSFGRAKDDFTTARTLLGPDWLRSVPVAGPQLAAAQDLSTIGLEGSTAGLEAATLLDEIAKTPPGADRLAPVFAGRQHLDTALASLAAIADRVDDLNTLDTSQLWDPLAEAVRSVQTTVKPLQPVLDRSHSLLTLERFLFAEQRRFVVLSQSGAELRPTGGWIGSYGLIGLGPDGFTVNKFANIYALPVDTLHLPMPTGAGFFNEFRFRDSNWWIDFPTSAPVLLRFWQNMKQPPIDGFIAIDTETISELLRVFGPVKVPESTVPITADNLVRQLTTVIEYQMHRNKSALVSLADELMKRVVHMDSAKFQPTMSALADSANQKHVQFYLTDPAAQQAMVSLGWAGAVNPSPNVTDLLAVVNATVPASKANIGITKKADYRVALSAGGDADTTLQLTYTRDTTTIVGSYRQWWGDYLRVYRLTGTRAAPEPSTPGVALTTDEMGLPTFAHQFRVDQGQTVTEVVRSLVPNALRPVASDGGASGSAGRRYELLLVKQADLEDTPFAVTVNAPKGWKVASATAHWRVTGDPAKVSVTGGRVQLSSRLHQDLILDVDVVPA